LNIAKLVKYQNSAIIKVHIMINFLGNRES
jgi:hypothetical protein